MGIYLNPGNENFTQSVNSRIYVDKSMLLSEILPLVNTEDKHICISRARRFGKSMAANMLAAYFSKSCDSRGLFARLKFSKKPGYEKYLNKLNVLKFDVNGFYSDSKPGEDIVEKFTSKIRREMMKAFPDAEIDNEDSLPTCIMKAYEATGEQFIVILDEYDVLIREQVPEHVFQSYLKFLNAMFKNADLAPAIALAYLTGILPIVRDKVQSKLNLFREYTMLDAAPFTEFTGFTAEEAQSLCRQHGMDFDECRRWYDGYNINGLELYSPCSVVNAMVKHKYGSYWNKTGSFESLVDFIKMDFNGMDKDIKAMLSGGRIQVNPTGYMNTMNDFHSKNDAYTYLLHIGYLAYDESDGTCRIPNSEVAEEWVNAIERHADYRAVFQLIEASKQLVLDTITGNARAVADALNLAHEQLCNNFNYNNEGAFQAIICLAYFYAKTKYTVIKEMTTGRGYADIVLLPYVPGIPAVIIELKRDTTPETALAQIREKRYFASLEKYSGSLLFAGVTYSGKTKKHSCAIETFQKTENA